MRAIAAVLFLALLTGRAVQPAIADAANGAESLVTLPSGNDDFAKLAARAAAQDQSLDFRALRFAWLKSAQRKHPGADEDAARSALFTAVKGGDATAIRDAAIKLLSVNYVDLFGHKFLRQSCAILHDDACATAGHFLEFGLLNSNVHTGDGKTCPTGWEVVSVKEEYFVLSMLGASMRSQALMNGPPSCDRMDVTDESGNDATYYFRIEAVLADEAEALGLK